ncbi:MAG: hydratase [Lactimicrobium massiliense]|nr:hydratase [Lactimicrobium massiliense]MDD6457321.1 hydratase [Lactimicrobium massiliense]
MKLIDKGVVIEHGRPVIKEPDDQNEAVRKTIAAKILREHDDHQDPSLLHIRFDSLTSHDITYVGIIQTARASGMKSFPVPYVLTNCHNTLCAVGGTINEDDHQFALSAAHKYGGIYVPPGLAVIHSYNREMMSGCGRMILGSDSHTRYGALGTMGIGEGGGELARQLVSCRYELKMPEVVLVYVHGKVKPGIGPHDVALALCGAVYANGFVKNRVMEFAGPGIASLSQEFRNGIDVMTTETTCLSSIWETDDRTADYFARHGRPEAYKPLRIEDGAYYQRCIDLDLDEISSMIALPMHPSYALPVKELKRDPYKYLQEAQDRANKQLNGAVKMDLVSHIDDQGRIHVDQGIIAGCSGGTYENIYEAAEILAGHDTGCGEFRLSVYPDSMPVYKGLVENGAVDKIITAGGIFREAFCGPCFGAGETPANGEFSIRHTTRNFPNREGSKPTEGQLASVGLMDARSIAATAVHQGILTAADEEISAAPAIQPYTFDGSIYTKRVYNGWQKADPAYQLRFGPNIKDWPQQPALKDSLLVKVVSHLDDPVTTTDELIPSGETSSFRSNPERLAQFTLSRRDPDYVSQARQIREIRNDPSASEIQNVLSAFAQHGIHVDPAGLSIGSAIYARKPGDGSAREQAASCQRVLGGAANFAKEYATKRYRSNCINWGMIPFVTDAGTQLPKGAWVLITNARQALLQNLPYQAWVWQNEKVDPLTVETGDLSEDEREILADGCLINYYRSLHEKQHAE